MARNLIASKLIESVRDRAMIPDDISVYDDETILNILNEEIDVGLLDTLLTLNEEHLVTYVDVNNPIAPGRFIIPSRAIGNKLRDISIVVGERTYELSRVDLGELSDYDYGNGLYSSSPDVFYIEGDEIVLVNPHYRGASTVRMYFYITPNNIVMEDTCAKINNIDRINGVIQFENLPKELNTIKECDFVQNTTPNKILGTNIEVQSINLSTRSITVLPESIPRRLSIGDWFCNVEESPYPNIPTEMHPLLAQRAAVHILEAMGDGENYGMAMSKLTRMEKSIQKLLDNRVEGAPRKIKNRYGTLNSGGIYSNRYNRRRI